MQPEDAKTMVQRYFDHLPGLRTSGRLLEVTEMTKDDFIAAIRAKKKVRVTFFSKEDRGTLVRKCAPTDYGPSRKAKAKNDRYHVWDYESDTTEHSLSLKRGQIQQIEILDESFEPSEFVTWNVEQFPWFVPRDWGIYS
jgi:hypothetical protein